MATTRELARFPVMGPHVWAVVENRAAIERVASVWG
jgi:hypothetical protein